MSKNEVAYSEATLQAANVSGSSPLGPANPGDPIIPEPPIDLTAFKAAIDFMKICDEIHTTLAGIEGELKAIREVSKPAEVFHTSLSWLKGACAILAVLCIFWAVVGRP
jgi:hypothetical protein